MNPIAVVFILLGIFSLWKPKYTIICMGGAAAFQVAMAFDNGAIRLWVYYAFALFVCLNAVFRFGLASSLLQKKCLKELVWLYCVTGVVVIGALTLPFLFFGTPVFESRGGMDFSTINELYPLRFTTSNIAQAIYLIVNLLVLTFLVFDRNEKSFILNMQRGLILFFGIGLFFVFWQALALRFGIYFPEFLVHGDSYDQAYQTSRLVIGVRMNGSFGEPADLGMFSGACVGYGLGTYLLARRRLVGGILFVGGMTSAFFSGSTTAYVAAFGAIASVLLFWRSIKINLIEVCVLAFILLATIFLLFRNEMVIENFLTTVIAKNQSGSYLNRMFSITYSIELFLQTFGLGVGLGSHRPSSMLALLVACLGLFALPVIWLLFVVPFRILKTNNPFYKSVFCAYCAVLASILTSIPDMSNVVFAFLTVCVLSIAIRVRVARAPTARQTLVPLRAH